MSERELVGIGRDELLKKIEAAIDEHKGLEARYQAALLTIQENGETIRTLRSERDSYLVNLTSTQARCTELLTQLRTLQTFHIIRPSQCMHPHEMRKEWAWCLVGWCRACGSIDTGVWEHPG